MKTPLPLAILLWLMSTLVSFGATKGRDPVREAEVEQQLAKFDPTLVETFRQATVASDAHQFSEAERLFETVVARAPNFDAALRRLGSAKAMQGPAKRAAGIALAEKAVSLNRSSDNLAALAYLLAFTPGASHGEEDRAMNALIEARALPHGSDADNLAMIAQLALQRQNLPVARETVALLQQKYDGEMPTHYFAAYLAASEEKWRLAAREIRRAEKLGLDSSVVQKFLDAGVQSRATGWTIAGGAAWTIGLWIGGLIALFLLGFALSKATLRQVERSDPNVPISPAEHRLRRIYRGVLNVAGIYYYISLPIVLVLVIGAVALAVYGCLLAGWLPIKLLLILGIGACATIWAMLRSLFLRVKGNDSGRALQRSEAPGLWQLAEEVAAALQTRPIDEIRLTVGTELCVYERGSWREKLENRAQRVLVIGVAVLEGFKQQDFRSVLAHEYGHFSHRDTAGGDIAMRVRSDMLKFYYAMLHAGQATWLNMGFHFLRVYHFIFRRISHGATRLQEVLADRVAAQNYGAAAFEGGLRHVIRQSIVFDTHAGLEIETAIKARRPLQNLYAADAARHGESVETEFAKQISRETTDDDTHPAPKDRFRLVAKIPEPARAVSQGLVWELFADREAILQEMTATVEKNIASHRT